MGMCYSIRINELEDFVHNKAKPDDILTAYDHYLDRHYYYLCTDDNIGKNVSPSWMTSTNFLRTTLIEKFKKMTLDEKVDFLIEEYISNEILNSK